MSSFLGPALKAIVMGRQGVLQGRQHTAEMEREANMMKLKMALQQQPKDTARWETKETENGLVQVNPITGEVRPLLSGGSPLKGKPSATTTPSLQHIETEDGIMLLDPKTGEVRPALMQGKTLKPPAKEPKRDPVADRIAVKQWERAHPAPQGAGSDKPPSESERRASGLLEQMRRSADVVKNYEPHLGQIASKVGIIGNYQLKHDPKTQMALQAGAQLYRSYLYTVSGATVNPDEAEQAAQTYLPQPGDSPEVIAQKRQSIDDMIRTVETMAGRALKTPGATSDLVPNDRAAALKQKYGIR